MDVADVRLHRVKREEQPGGDLLVYGSDFRHLEHEVAQANRLVGFRQDRCRAGPLRQHIVARTNVTPSDTPTRHHSAMTTTSPRLPAGLRLPDLTAADVTIVPANQASWEDLQAVFGVRGYTSTCQCQRFKLGPYPWRESSVAVRQAHLRRETHCDFPSSLTTSGILAYLDGEPVGWCAVESRSAYRHLPWQRTKLAVRGEDPTDQTVWAVTCFATRAGYRRRGISRVLAAAAVDFARKRGARAVEAYPMITEPGVEITWGETHVGTRSIFEAAGMTEVLRASLRRVVMRIDFELNGGPPDLKPSTKRQGRRS